MLSLIVPLAARLPRGALGCQRPLRRRRKRPPRRPALRAVSRRRLVAAGFAATAMELAAVLARHPVADPAGSLLAGAGLSLGSALAGFANVWPLALLFAGLGIVVTGWSLRTSVGHRLGRRRAGGDVRGRPDRPLDPSLSGIRYVSVFKYYGNAILDGIDPLAFAGMTLAACALAALGSWLFDRRDLAP